MLKKSSRNTSRNTKTLHSVKTAYFLHVCHKSLETSITSKAWQVSFINVIYNLRTSILINFANTGLGVIQTKLFRISNSLNFNRALIIANIEKKFSTEKRNKATAIQKAVYVKDES